MSSDWSRGFNLKTFFTLVSRCLSMQKQKPTSSCPAEKIGLQCPMFSPPTPTIGCYVGSDGEILKMGKFSSGDGGNRTRVQRTRPRICYKLSRPFVSHPLHPRPTECEAGQAIRDRGPGFDTPYRRRERRTPISMTPAPGPPEESLGRRSRSGRLERSDAA